MAWGDIDWTSGGTNSGGGLADFNFFNPSSPGDCCAPVTIYDAYGNPVATIASGGSYTLNPQEFTRAITIKAGWTGGAISFLAYAKGTISVLSSTNVASAVYTRQPSGATTTPPYAVGHNEIININITPTSSLIDAVLVLRGIFDTVAITETTPVMGENGRKKYVLCQAAAPNTIVVSDTGAVGYPNLATIVLTAGVTYGSVAYRGIDNCVYAFGQNGIDSFVVSKIDCTTDTVITTTTFAGTTQIGNGFIPFCYNHTEDVFHGTSQGAAGSPIVKYFPATNTRTFINTLNIVAYQAAHYFGYADKLENTFSFSGGGSAVWFTSSTDNAGYYETVAQWARTGVVGQAFNRTNRRLYINEFNTGLVRLRPGLTPEEAIIATGAGATRSGVCFDPIRNKIFGDNIGGLSFAWHDVAAATVGTVAVAAVGAETGFKAMEYGEYSDRIFMLSRGGNIVRVIDPATNALDAVTPTITVGAQNTGTTTGWNCMCFNRVKI